MGISNIRLDSEAASYIRGEQIRADNPSIGAWTAAWAQNNHFADWAQAQDKEGKLLRDKKFPLDKEYVLDYKQAQKDGLSFPTLAAAAQRGELTSQSGYDNLLARVNYQKGTKDVLSASNGFVNFAYAVPAFLTNPINIPEIGFFAFTGGQSALARLAVGATLASTTAYIDETDRQKDNALVDEELTSQIVAFSAIFGGVANGVFGRRLDEMGGASDNALPIPTEGTVLPPHHALNPSDNIMLMGKNGQLRNFDGSIPEGSAASWSVLGSLIKSGSSFARWLGAGLQTSGVSKTVVGATYMGDTVQHVNRTVQSAINIEQGVMKNVWKNSYKQQMTEADFYVKVYENSAARRMNGELLDPDMKSAVDSFDRAIKKTGEFLEDAGMSTKGDYLFRDWSQDMFEKLGRTKIVQLVAKALRAKSKSNRGRETSEAMAKLRKAESKLKPLKGKRFARGSKQAISRLAIQKEIKSLKRQIAKKEMSQEEAEATAGRLFDNVTGEEGFARSDSMKRRSLDLDEGFEGIGALLNKNAGELLSNMSYRMAGRIATQKVFGFHSNAELTKILKQTYKRVLKETGSKKEAIKVQRNFEMAIKHAWGIQMKSDLPVWGQLMKKGIMDLNFATIGGGFAATAAMGEIALPIMMAGWKVGLRAIGMSLKQFKNLYKELPMDTPAMAKIQLAMHAFDKTNHSLVSRYANDMVEGYQARHWLTDKLAKASEFVSNTLPLSTVTSAARNAVGLAMLDDIFYNPSLIKQLKVWEQTGKMSADLKKLTRLQIDIRKLREIQAKADEIFTWSGGARGKGDLLDYDLTKLGSDDMAMINRGLSNASDLNILMGNKEHLPSFWSNPNNVPLHIMTQFMSYPLHAYESLLLRGMDERSAAMVVGVVTSATFTSILMFSKEEFLISTGMMEEEDRKYDVSTSEGRGHLAVKMLNTSSLLAPMSVGLNLMKTAFTGEALGSNYRQNHWAEYLGGPTVSRLNDILKSIQLMDFDPTDEHSNSWNTTWGRTIMMNSGLPLYTTPILMDGMRNLNEWMAGK